MQGIERRRLPFILRTSITQHKIRGGKFWDAGLKSDAVSTGGSRATLMEVRMQVIAEIRRTLPSQLK